MSAPSEGYEPRVVRFVAMAAMVLVALIGYEVIRFREARARVRVAA
jgi:hypothetical protein